MTVTKVFTLAGGCRTADEGLRFERLYKDL